MSLLTQFKDERRHISNALRGASSPHSWRQMIAPQVKSAMEIGYCFNWIKQVEIEPRLHSSLLVGECLSNMFCENEIEGDSQNITEKTSNLAAIKHPIFEAIKPGKEVFVASTSTKKKALFAGNKTETQASLTKGRKSTSKSNRVKNRQISQIYSQQKTVTVSCLNQWVNDRDQKLIKVNKEKAKEPLSSQVKSPFSPVKLADKKQIRCLQPSLANKNHYRARWQQQINQRVEKILNCIQQKDWAAKSKQKTAFNETRTANKISTWEQQVCRENESSKRISTDLLRAIDKTQQKPSRDFTVLKERHYSKRLNEPKTLPEGESSSTWPSSSRPESNRQSLKNKQASNNSQLIVEQSQSTNKAELVTQKQKIDRANNQGVEDKNKKSRANEFPTIESPEFPPVKKHIIEELQASGKRTALKSETNKIEECGFELNEDELAETLKRIIDEQARRQGINV